MKIVVIGGGTAGWLAALMVKKVHGASVDVTLIESSAIGIIGAGEGSTGFINEIIQNINWNYGCSMEDFFKQTNATVKLGIRHRDWKEVGKEYIAPLGGTVRNEIGTDYILMNNIVNDVPFHLSSEDGYMIDKSLSSFYFDEDGKISSKNLHAYHFDGRLVGQYFKSVCGDEVTSIDAKVVDVNVDANGYVKSLILDSNNIIHGDFFIDASGFSRLISKKLNVGWKSYRDNLPLNRAMPFFLPLPEKVDPVTTAWAQKNGWMWMIPTQERLGCGYVFDDRFVSEEEAHREIEECLGIEVDPIRFLEFDAGRSEQLWKNNVLFVGLSAAFAEPLEATSIHTTIMQLRSFVFDYLRDTVQDTCNLGSIEIYNKKMSKMYDDMMNFINIHYVGGRSDSEFWKWVSTGEIFTEQTKYLLDMQKHKALGPNDFDNYFGSAGSPIYNWIMAGLGIIDKNLAKKELDFYGQKDTAEMIWNFMSQNFDQLPHAIIDNTEFIKNVRSYSEWQ